MARGKVHSMELRWKIIDLHKAGMSACKIAKNLGISSTSAHYIINKYEKCGVLGTRRKSGGAKSITPEEDRQIIMLRSLPVRVSAAKILNILNMTRSVPLGIDTIKKRVREIKEARLRGEEIPPLFKKQDDESFLENVNPDLILATPTPIKKNHNKTTNSPTAASTPKSCNQVNGENHMDEDDDEFYLFEESLPDDEDYVPTGLPPFQLRMRFRGMRKKLKDFTDKKKKKKRRKKKTKKPIIPKIAKTTATAPTKRKRAKRKPKDLPIPNIKELKVMLKKANVQNLQNTKNNNIVRNNTRPSRTNGQKNVTYEVEDSSEDDVIFVG